MASIQGLINYIQLVLRTAAQHYSERPAILADPLRLVRLVMNGEKRRAESERRIGAPVPRFCIFSVTWQCNLQCAGCYASRYTRGNEITPETIKRVIGEAIELGSYLFIIVGGEPLMVPGLFDTLEAYDNAIFLLFTNGTLFTDEQIARIAQNPMIFPVISLEGEDLVTDQRRGEGVADKVADTMRRLREAHIPFGFSSTVTHNNLSQVTSPAWVGQLRAQGAWFGLLIDYSPMPGDDPAMLLTDDDRAMKTRAMELCEKTMPLPMVNFPADEYGDGACLSAGRGFIHVNADGFVEPCPFCHYATDNIRDKSLAEILTSPFFTRLRNEIPDGDPAIGRCSLLMHRELVEKIVQETGAVSTEGLPSGT